MEDGLISQQQASEILGVSRQRVNQMLKLGQLTPVPLAGRRLLMAAQVQALQEKRARTGLGHPATITPGQGVE